MDNDTTLMLAHLAFTVFTTTAFAIIVYVAVYRPQSFDHFLKIAEGYRKPLGDIPPPAYYPPRLWRIALLIAAFIGMCNLLYGVCVSLFAWMPYDWRTEYGMWEAKHFAMITAFFAALPLAAHFLNYTERYYQLQRCREVMRKTSTCPFSLKPQSYRRRGWFLLPCYLFQITLCDWFEPPKSLLLQSVGNRMNQKFIPNTRWRFIAKAGMPFFCERYAAELRKARQFPGKPSFSRPLHARTPVMR